MIKTIILIASAFVLAAIANAVLFALVIAGQELAAAFIELL